MTAPSTGRMAGTLVLLTLVWGTTWSVIRVGLEGIPPLTGVSLRFGIAAAVLFVLAWRKGVRFGTQPYERRLWVINGLLSFCVSYGVVYWAEQYVPSGLTAVLFATYPLFMGVLGHFLLSGERLDARSIVGIVVGFGGVAVIFSEDFEKLGGPMVATAAAVMLISPFVSAIASVAVKRWGRSIHPYSITAVPMLIAFVVMGVLALLFERDLPVRFDTRSVSALLYLALAGSALTFSLYFWLLKHFRATRLALITYAIPVVAVAIGAVALDEPITPKTIGGTALVIAGVAMAIGRRG